MNVREGGKQRKEIMKEGKKREKGRDKLGGNGRQHVRYTRFTITRSGSVVSLSGSLLLSRQLYESFFVSLWDLFLRLLPTHRLGRAVRAFALATCS